ncbi:MAG: hypothetical protein EBV76_11475, partial [Gammaproteobacteria bacterium]|nr:hypothetical protein [Gammaproteobacteria bacterium]
MNKSLAAPVLVWLAAALNPSVAAAQVATPEAAATPEATTPEQPVDVDIVGEIVIVGRRDRDIQQATNVVLSVL